jgi:hypothetical protein
MITFDPSASNLCKAEHRFVPAFTISPVQVVIDAGSSEGETHEDANVLVEYDATIDTNRQITSNKFARTSYTSETPSIATVSDTGYVQRVSDGTALIRARTGTNDQRLRCPVSRVTPTTGTTFESWVFGTLAAFADTAVRGSIEGVEPSSATRSIFDGEFRNLWLFCSAYEEALTAIVGSRNGSGWMGFTAITPRHTVHAAHAVHGVGDTLIFKTVDGTSVTRTTTHRYVVPGTDIVVFLLDSDLPASIKPMPLAPTNIGDFLRNPEYGVPLLFADRNNLMNAVLSYQLTSDILSLTAPSGDMAGFYDFPEEGTSGKPVMIPYSATGLALLMTFTSPNHGPSYHARDWPAIIAALDALGGVSTGYLPARANLSAFTEF